MSYNNHTRRSPHRQPAAPPPTSLVTLWAASGMTGASIDQIQGLIDHGAIQAEWIGNQLYISLDALDAAIAGRSS